jgi:MFS family permease
MTVTTGVAGRDGGPSYGMTNVDTTAFPHTDASRWSRTALFTVVVCFAINMIDGMDIMLMSYIAPSLQQAWGVGPSGLSIVFSAGLAGMALGGLVLAPLADRYGRKRMVLLSLALMSAAMMASSRAQTVWQLVGLRVLVGIGIGTVLACIAALAAEHAPPRYRNFAVGILQGGYPIGAMLSGFVTAWALPVIGWHGVLLGAGLLSLLALPLVAWLLPGSSHAHAQVRRHGIGEAIGGGRLRASLRLWVAAICAVMALYFIASWITKLAIGAGLPQTQAIVASAVYNGGAFLGVTAMSIAATHIDIRKLACVFLVLAAFAFLWFGGVRMSLGFTLLAACVMGITLQGGFNALYPLAARVYPEEMRATGIGWAMGLGRIGAFAGPLVGGWILGMDWPLVAVFGVFCVPLLIAAAAARKVRLHGE